MADKPKSPDPKPADKPDDKAKNVITDVSGQIKKMFGDELNPVLSLLNPFIGDSAEAAADKVKKVLPANHWFLTKKGESIIGVVAALIEKESDKHREPTKALLEKASDWFEQFGRALRTSQIDTAKGTERHKPDGAKNSEVISNHYKEFLKNARIKMAAAKPDEKKALAKELQKEGQFYEKLIVLMTEGLPKKAPKPEPPKEKGEPWTEKFKVGWSKFKTGTEDCWTKGSEKLQSLKKSTDSKLEAQRIRNEPAAERIGEVLENPLKILLGLVFGFKSKKTTEAKKTQPQQTKPENVVVTELHEGNVLVTEVRKAE